MKVIIPVAGYATRLYPLTLHNPKSLLKIQGKPILEHLLNKLKELSEVTEVWIVTNQFFFPVFQKWLNRLSWNKNLFAIQLINDGTTSNENRLGQIGDISLVMQKAQIHDEDVLIVAGDNLFNFSLLPAYRYFKKNNVFLNTLSDVQSKKTASEQGTAVLNGSNKIIEFQEKAPAPKSTLISHGIYFIPKNKLSIFHDYVSQKRDLDKMGYFMLWLVNKKLAYGFVYRDQWFDIGWKESLMQTEHEFKCNCR